MPIWFGPIYHRNKNSQHAPPITWRLNIHLPFFVYQIPIPKKEYTNWLGPVGFMYWWKAHYVKDVQIRSFFWSEYGKIRTRKNSVFGHFSHTGKRNNAVVRHTAIAWQTLMIYGFIWRKLIHPMQSSDFSSPGLTL